MKYASENFPDIELIAKSDDDLFICPMQLVSQIVKEFYSSKNSNLNPKNLYFGWQWFFNKPFNLAGSDILKEDFCGTNIKSHPNEKCFYGQVNSKIRMDEFFIILGRNLVKNILKFEYCYHPHPKVCKDHKPKSQFSLRWHL